MRLYIILHQLCIILHSIQPLPQETPQPKPTNEDIEATVKNALNTIEELVTIKEPNWYKMGLYLKENHPGSKVAEFGKPNRRSTRLSHFGLASLEVTKKIYESIPVNKRRELSDFSDGIKSRMLEEDCPLKGRPRCSISSKKYRTHDGTCNNIKNPWRGASMLPMQRFLPPLYEDGIQSIRRSVLGSKLPSAREISAIIHTDKNQELHFVTLMFMQWGQFIDHDVTSVAKTRSFNGSVPRCCDLSGGDILPLDQLHPSCLPIEVPENDRFYSRFGIKCMEFIRSAASTRINCDLGWREQINQASSYIDASMIYGNDDESSGLIRTFRSGKIIYGAPGGDLCNAGALTSDCFQSGDGRVMEQPGLTALHTVWVRYHNQIASKLSRLNRFWSDEKIYQETRKIVYSLIQHITYNEFLPVLLGPEVIKSFNLELSRKGFYTGYDPRVDATVANSFSAAAYRFGHSMVQNSFVRSDEKHRPIFNNVSLHDEFVNFENIWSFGSVDRTLLGFCNQPSQRRDEYICDELSNHLFQSPGLPFGMDLTAINIQRGRDHGVPPYTSWREPCGLTPIKNWRDLEKIFSVDTLKRFRKVYRHVDDVDLFSGGLAEKPVKGAVVGPTFACIIAQQFSNLRKGDRFWYENKSSFTPAQLQQIRRVTLGNILCNTLDEIETIQPFTFLSPDHVKNTRRFCTDDKFKDIDLLPWVESRFNDINDIEIENREGTHLLDLEDTPSNRRRLTKLKYKNKKKPSKASNKITINTNKTADYNAPIEVNIKIQYFPPKPNPKPPTFIIQSYPEPLKPPLVTSSSDYDEVIFEDKPFSSSSYSKPFYKPVTNHFLYNEVYTTKKPLLSSYDQDFTDYFYQNYNKNTPVKIVSTGYVHKVNGIDDKLDFKSKLVDNKGEVKDKFVKISSVKSQAVVSSSSAIINTVLHREGEGEVGDEVKLVDVDVAASDTGDWLMFDELEELSPKIEVPTLEMLYGFSEETPEPIKT